MTAPGRHGKVEKNLNKNDDNCPGRNSSALKVMTKRLNCLTTKQNILFQCERKNVFVGVVFPTLWGLDTRIDNVRPQIQIYVNVYVYIQIMRSIGLRLGQNIKIDFYLFV